MTNRTRDVLNMVEDAGRDFPLEIVERVEKNARIYVELRAGNGATRQFSISNTSRNDVRGDLNEKGRMKRFARDNAPRTEPPASAETVAALVTQKPEPAQIVVPKTRTTLTMKNTQKPAQVTPAPAPARTIDVSVKAAREPEPTPATRELTPIEFYKLCEWVKATDLSRSGEIEVAVIRATDALQCAVSEPAFREAMQAVGKTEPDDWTKVEEPHVVVARELYAVMQELGHSPSLAFCRLMQSLA